MTALLFLVLGALGGWLAFVAWLEWSGAWARAVRRWYAAALRWRAGRRDARWTARRCGF